MIIVRLMGGQGNQMFQYALGRRLAYERQTTLKLDLTWFQTQTLRHYMLDCLKINSEIATPQDIARLTKSNWTGISGVVYQAIQRRLPYYQRIIVEENKFGFDPCIFQVRNNVYLTGYWQSEKYFSSISQVVRDEFQLMRALSQESTTWKRKIQSYNAVSVHIRRGDYANDPKTNQVHGILPPEYYRQATEYVFTHITNPKLFIFSDDLPWVRQNLNFLSAFEFVDIERENRDEEELVLMSLCNHHIIANSSYSWWGAWLGVNAEKIVIAPQLWFTNMARDTNDLIPETWIRM